MRLLAIILTFVHFAEQAGNTDVLDHKNFLDRLKVAGRYVPTMTWPTVLFIPKVKRSIDLGQASH